jgi:tripartite-type tricarboxylate transporter receptor subunit TctC
LGVDLIGGTPDEFAAYVNARLAEMKDVAKAANLVPQ